MDFDSAHDSDSQPLSDAVTGNSESNTEDTDNSRPDVATSRARQIIANTNPVRRASFAPSRLSAVFDPNVISTWWNAVGGQQDTTKAQRRATVIDYNSVKTGLGTIRGDISLLASDVVDEDLDSIFASFLVDLGLPEHARMKMMSMPDDQKRLILHSNEQAQAFRQQRLDRQQEQIQNQSSFGLSSSESNTDDLTSPKDAQLNQSAMTGESSHNNDADPNTKSSHRLSGGSWSSVESTSPTSSQPTNVQEERPLSPTSSSVARGFLKYWFGSLTSSTKSQDTPEYYIGELTQRNTQQVLANRLTSLRVTLSHVKMAWIRSFLDLNGLSVLEAILEKLTDLNKNRAAKRSDHDDKIQTECIRCLRVLMNTEPGFGRVIQSPSLISCIVFSLSTRNHKLRAQVADVLAALCVLSLEGHRLVLNALSDFRNIHEEKYRFEHLVETLINNEDEEDSSFLEYKTACLSLINAIVNSPEEVEERVILREEFTRRGLEEVFASIKTSNPPESLLTQINVYEEEYQDDLDEFHIKVHDLVRDPSDPTTIILDLLRQVEYDQSLYPRVVNSLKNMLRIACQDTRESFQDEIWTMVEIFLDRFTTISNIREEWQDFLRDYHDSIEHIVGKYHFTNLELIDEEVHNAYDQNERCIDTPKTSESSSGNDQLSASPPPIQTRPKPALKQLFWSKILPSNVSFTVWKDIPEDEISLDYTELDELFSKSTPVSSSNKTSTLSPPIKRPTVTTLLDLNRANNIAIMLARIRMPYPEIKQALLEVDDEKLTIENLRAIRQHVPTTEELELVKEYDGDTTMLGNSERYFKEIIVIPRLTERLNCMIFRRRFELEAEELVPELSILHNAHDELKSSRKLKKLLKIVLAIGNYLNGSSFRGNAYGFQLEALLKMRDTKAVENNAKGTSTLLHYLANTLEEKQRDLITFMDELPHLEVAARVSVVTLMASVSSLATGIAQIREEIRVLKRIRLSPENDKFIEVMNAFVDDAEPKVASIRDRATKLDEELKQLLVYYGEDPSVTKPEDFFGLIVSFASSLAKARKDNEELRRKAEKERENQVSSRMQSSRRQSDTASVSSSLAGKGELDETIQQLRAGLRRSRGRPVSRVFMEIHNEEFEISYDHTRDRSSYIAHHRERSSFVGHQRERTYEVR